MSSIMFTDIAEGFLEEDYDFISIDERVHIQGVFGRDISLVIVLSKHPQYLTDIVVTITEDDMRGFR